MNIRSFVFSGFFLILASCSENKVAVRTMRDRDGLHSWRGSFLTHPDELKLLYEKQRYGFAQIDFLSRGQVRLILKDIEKGVTHKIMGLGKKVGEETLELSCEFIASFKAEGAIYLRKRGKSEKFMGSLQASVERQKEFLQYLESSDIVKERIPEEFKTCSGGAVNVTRRLKGKSTIVELGKKISLLFIDRESEDLKEFARTLPQGPDQLLALKHYEPLSLSWVFGGLANRVVPSPKTLSFFVLPRLSIEGTSFIPQENKLSISWTRNQGVSRKKGTWMHPRLVEARLIAISHDGSNKKVLGTAIDPNGMLQSQGVLLFSLVPHAGESKRTFELDFTERELKFTLSVAVALSPDQKVISVKPEVLSRP